MSVHEAIKREMSGDVYDRAQKKEKRLTKLNDARRRSIFYEERSDKQNRIKTGRSYTVRKLKMMTVIWTRRKVQSSFLFVQDLVCRVKR